MQYFLDNRAHPASFSWNNGTPDTKECRDAHLSVLTTTDGTIRKSLFEPKPCFYRISTSRVTMLLCVSRVLPPETEEADRDARLDTYCGGVQVRRGGHVPEQVQLLHRLNERRERDANSQKQRRD